MRPAMRSLVFLYWIYSFVGSAIGVFLQIYLYELFSSVRLNIIAALISFTGIMIGFCVYGYVASLFRFNARHGFLLSFASMSIGIFAMAASHTFLQACMAMLLVGIGGGFFWLTIHTYELVETRDEERDIYSTVLSVGDQVFSLAGPAFATLLILGAHLLHWGDFSLLHSRYYAKKNGRSVSKLCFADKLAIAMTPHWLYLPMVTATGEIKEYLKMAQKADSTHWTPTGYDKRKWHAQLCAYMISWVEEHKNGGADTWTDANRHAKTDSGVWT